MSPVQSATRIDERVKGAVEKVCKARGEKMNHFIRKHICVSGSHPPQPDTRAGRVHRGSRSHGAGRMMFAEHRVVPTPVVATDAW